MNQLFGTATLFELHERPALLIREVFKAAGEWIHRLKEEKPQALPYDTIFVDKLADAFNQANSVIPKYYFGSRVDVFDGLIDEIRMHAKQLIDSPLGGAWNHFEKSVRNFDNKCVSDFVEKMDFVDSHAHQIFPRKLHRDYPDYLFNRWNYVSLLLNNCQLVSKTETYALLKASIEFLYPYYVQFGLPVAPGFWTEVDVGRFRPLTADEVSEARNTKQNVAFVAGEKDFLLSIFKNAPLPHEQFSKIVNIKNEDNKRWLNSFSSLITAAIGAYTGFPENGDVVGALGSAMRAANTAIELVNSDLRRRRQHDLSAIAVQSKKKKKASNDSWVASCAQALLNDDPGLTDADIAAILSSKDECAKYAEELSDPIIRKQLMKGTSLKTNTIRKKLREAHANGLVDNPRIRSVSARRA